MIIRCGTEDFVNTGSMQLSCYSTVNPDGSVSSGSTTAMSGYTVIEVDSMDRALDFAKTCPFLEIGGSLEVSELVQMQV